MIKVGIIGSTGYAGGELVRILMGHKNVEIKWFGSRSYIEKKYADVYRNMFQIVDAVCMDDNMEELADEVDVIFTATPQGLCASLVTEEILRKVKIIDLSADFRIKDVQTYEEWYQIKHPSPKFLEEAVYGLCEVNRKSVKNARLVANPGCYPTCSFLSIYPLAKEGLIDMNSEAVYGLCEVNRKSVKNARLVANPGCYPTCSFLSIYPLAKEGLIDMNSIIIDAKSGTSGAGRGAKVDNLYCEVNENIKAYGVASHRHTPEIEEQLGYASNEKVTLNFTPHLVPMNRGILITAYASLKKKVTYEDVPEIEEQLGYASNEKVTLNFTPHLVPMNRGILITAYASLKKKVTYEDVKAIYDSYYKNEKFVRVLEKDVCPQTKWVEGSNYVDVNFKIDPRTNRVIMMGAMDNLVKGAAGQAVQNMNLMFGLSETEGLELVPMFP